MKQRERNKGGEENERGRLPSFYVALDVLQYFASLHIWIWPMNVGAAGPQSAGDWAGVESQ